MNKFLQVENIRREVNALADKIWGMPIEQLPIRLRNEVEAVWDPEEQQRALHHARYQLIQWRVLGFEESLRHAVCKRCGGKFEYFEFADTEKLPLDGYQEKSPEQPFCIPCCAAHDRDLREAEFFKLCRSARYYLRDTSNPPRPAQFEQVKNWPTDNSNDDDKQGGFLLGKSGTGKTTSLNALFHRLVVDDCEDAIICDAVSMGDTIGEAARGIGDYGSVSEYFDYLSNYYFLAIDDLDKARFTPRVATEIFHLIEMWCRDLCRPLFITSNSSLKELANLFPGKIGPAVVTRIKAHCIPVDFNIAPQAQPVPVTKISPPQNENDEEEVEHANKEEDHDEETTTQ